jgi:UDP-N-acetylglucosamine transferase subunit ALG13
VPDYPQPERRLAGDLVEAVQINIPVTYIGPQSYLSTIKPNEQTFSAVDYLILLSGEEPQRSILEELLLKKFRNSEKKIVLVRGTNLKKRPVTTVEVIDFAYGETLLKLIVNAKTVICRSGYSTLMDLHLLNKRDLILIPTPGQTEQEYLASYWQQKFGTKTVLQKEIEGFEFNS